MLGSVAAFVKRELLAIPVFGWLLWFQDCVPLSRDWRADGAAVLGRLGRLCGAGAHAPGWLLIFPEGTRRTAEKQRASNAFAARAGKAVTRSRALQPSCPSLPTANFAPCLESPQ